MTFYQEPPLAYQNLVIDMTNYRINFRKTHLCQVSNKTSIALVLMNHFLRDSPNYHPSHYCYPYYKPHGHHPSMQQYPYYQ